MIDLCFHLFFYLWLFVQYVHGGCSALDFLVYHMDCSMSKVSI